MLIFDDPSVLVEQHQLLPLHLDACLVSDTEELLHHHQIELHLYLPFDLNVNSYRRENLMLGGETRLNFQSDRDIIDQSGLGHIFGVLRVAKAQAHTLKGYHVLIVKSLVVCVFTVFYILVVLLQGGVKNDFTNVQRDVIGVRDECILRDDQNRSVDFHINIVRHMLVVTCLYSFSVLVRRIFGLLVTCVQLVFIVVKVNLLVLKRVIKSSHNLVDQRHYDHDIKRFLTSHPQFERTLLEVFILFILNVKSHWD